MFDVTDGLHAIVAQPSSHRDVFVKRHMPFEDNTQHLQPPEDPYRQRIVYTDDEDESATHS